jgi:hypothetical protein
LTSREDRARMWTIINIGPPLGVLNSLGAVGS